MCGIAGVIGSTASRSELLKMLQRMRSDLRHRGPDDSGIFSSADYSVGLVSTRLAILDLSPAGHQPMQSVDGRYTIVFNGEVYNYKELRKELADDGYNFRSRGDTEVVLAMYARYGADSVRELEGMFAFAIWDEAEKSLFLARDPLGVKPLYYVHRDQTFVFASEVRTLIDTGLIRRRLCQEAVASYLLFGAVQESLTLVEGVSALLAGHYLTAAGGLVRVTKYADVQFHAGPMTTRDARELVRSALEETVDRHLVSDVPVGVFLSGGIDSTALVAVAAEAKHCDLHTFSISFDDAHFNEGIIADKTAGHFRTTHTDWRLDSATAKELLGDFLARSDQPSVDGFNTFCVAKLAHDHGLKVVLSGLGGDEVFAGYQSFELVPRMVRSSRSLNLAWPFRSLVGCILDNPFAKPRTNRLGYFLQQPPTISAAYWAMRGIFNPREMDELMQCYGFEPEQKNGALQFYVPPQPSMDDDVSYLELTRYMRNQLLRDSDVMSMAWSLELRVPLADYKFIQAVARVPASIRLNGGKKLLLDAVPEIPAWVRSRPKQGFAFPFQDWVTSEWCDVFSQIESASPVRLKNWYRTWSLYALENFLVRNQIDAPCLLHSSSGPLETRPTT